ncbi:MAG: SDR family oxidoreductase [Desulfomonile tiedjei]|uniref:SDR family oxidoreductase n=1 Tax=Desulfomonile tiedjei TaxID=2358 RepID=A0A9D6Z486_9BACT|nr:SDR family oxidoreductase [Desulfomonile tiedjei]
MRPVLGVLGTALGGTSFTEVDSPILVNNSVHSTLVSKANQTKGSVRKSLKFRKNNHKPRLLITGGSGFMGGILALEAPKHWDTYATHRSSPPRYGDSAQWIPLDVSNREMVEKTLSLIEPEVIIHAAAVTDSRICERNPDTAWAINVNGTEHVADAAKKIGARLIYTSTDMVFGRPGEFRAEKDPPAPMTTYADTKYRAERIVSSLAPGFIIARICLSYCYSSNSARCFTEKIIDDLAKGVPTRLFVDEYRTPVYARDVCRILLEFAWRDDLSGLFHVGGPERLSRYEFGLKVCRIFGYCEDLLIPASLDEAVFEYHRPRDCSLNSEKLVRELHFEPLDVEQGLADMKTPRKC